MKKKTTAQKTAIPIHPLAATGGNNGMVIRQLANVNTATIREKVAHRDDHYQFIFQEKGSTHMAVDFSDVTLKARDILCILPGQVHRATAATHSHAWIISIQNEWVSQPYQAVFERFLLQPAVVSPDKQQVAVLNAAILFLQQIDRKTVGFHFSRQLLLGAIDTCIGVFAAIYKSAEVAADAVNSQPAVILRQFRTLLSRSYKTMKSPAGYAAALHISPSYLNEVIKEKTGFPVSYWIQHEIVTEANRLLYYTDMTVKELADTLGYDDHSYFSRFFKKVAGISPLHFRELSRE